MIQESDSYKWAILTYLFETFQTDWVSYTLRFECESHNYAADSVRSFTHVCMWTFTLISCSLTLKILLFLHFKCHFARFFVQCFNISIGHILRSIMLHLTASSIDNKLKHLNQWLSLMPLWRNQTNSIRYIIHCSKCAVKFLPIASNHVEFLYARLHLKILSHSCEYLTQIY